MCCRFERRRLWKWILRRLYLLRDAICKFVALIGSILVFFAVKDIFERHHRQGHFKTANIVGHENSSFMPTCKIVWTNLTLVNLEAAFEHTTTKRDLLHRVVLVKVWFTFLQLELDYALLLRVLNMPKYDVFVSKKHMCYRTGIHQSNSAYSNNSGQRFCYVHNS